MSTGEKIKIVCRIRPFLHHEVDEEVVRVTDKNTITLDNKRDPSRPFTYKSFSSCYAPDATQEAIFTQDVLPMVERVFQGYSSTVFTYGVTGSGKSYSLVGVKQDPGIIPRVAGFLFETKQASQVSSINITMSYMEILKETVFDMLVPKHKDIGLDIREDSNRNVFVPNLKESHIETYGDFSRLFNMANKNRSTASTKLNSRSSRSHAMLTFNVKTVTPIISDDGQQHEEVMVGKINLIDLAGSEDNRKSGNGKARMTESKAINKSLFVLGQVVEALNTGAIRVPFRDSKLTRILQSTLGGSSLGMMIINIAPGHNFISDTTNTLNFANRSKEIKSSPKVNVRRTKSVSRKHIPNSSSNAHPTRMTTPATLITPATTMTNHSTLMDRKIAAHDRLTRRLTISDHRSPHLDNNNHIKKRPFSTYEEMERNAKRSRLSLQPNSAPHHHANSPIRSSPTYHDTNGRSLSMHRLQRWLQEVPLHENSTTATPSTHHTTTKGLYHSRTSSTLHRSSPTRQPRTPFSEPSDSGGQEDEEMVIMTKADFHRLREQLKNQARHELISSMNGPLV